MFFSLPDEIVTQIICYLDKTDLYALRLTSRSLHFLLQSNAPTITRSMLESAWQNGDREYVQSLYPQPVPCPGTAYLLQMLHRQILVNKLLSMTVSFIQMKIYMITIVPLFDNFGHVRAALLKRLSKPTWTVYHFLERYRHLVVFEHPHHPMSTLNVSDCGDCQRAVDDLLSRYAPNELIAAYHLYGLILLHLRTSIRSPTHASTIERRLFGWGRKPPTDTDLSQVMILGGVEQLSKLSVMKGTYNQRLETIATFVDKVSAASATPRRIVFEDGGNPSTPLMPPDQSCHSLMREVDVPFDAITKAVIKSLPNLTQFVLREWPRRILRIVDDWGRIASPFGFVLNVLEGKEEGEDVFEPVKEFNPVAQEN